MEVLFVVIVMIFSPMLLSDYFDSGSNNYKKLEKEEN